MNAGANGPNTQVLHRLQGHVFRQIAGHERSQHLFVKHDDPNRVREIIEELLETEWVNPASEVDPDRPNVAVGLTYDALKEFVTYEPLRVKKDRSGSADEANLYEPDPFEVGMAGRAKLLGDPVETEWDGKNHGLLLWISDRPGDIDAAEDGSEDSEKKACVQAQGSRLDAEALACRLGLDDEEYYVEKGRWWSPTKMTREADPNSLLLGHIDGTSNPYVAEFDTKNNGAGLAGGGTTTPDGWKPVPLGEFALGRPDAADGLETPGPRWLTLDGTFIVYRTYKVFNDRYEQFLKTAAKDVSRQTGSKTLKSDVAAKVMGRYQVASLPTDGGPQDANDDRIHDSTIGGHGTTGPAWASWKPESPNDFRYDVDSAGHLCPLGAHMRRSNPRDALGFDGGLIERHRIIRRGSFSTSRGSDDNEPTEQELHFVAVNARIADGFEFIQRQWLNTGQRFRIGRDPDIVAGARVPTDEGVVEPVHMVIQGVQPAIVTSDKPIAELIGGDYFLAPGWHGLHQLVGKEPDGDR